MYFEGKSICISGKISGYSRTQVKNYLEQLNAVFKPNVSDKLDILVMGHIQLNLFYEQRKTTKQMKAEKLISEGSGITILSEENFISLLRDDLSLRANE